MHARVREGDEDTENLRPRRERKVGERVGTGIGKWKRVGERDREKDVALDH